MGLWVGEFIAFHTGSPGRDGIGLCVQSGREIEPRHEGHRALKMVQIAGKFISSIRPIPDNNEVTTGSHQRTKRTIAAALSKTLRCLRLRCWLYRCEGANTVKNGNAHARPIHAISTMSIRHTQRKPLALTTWLLLDRTPSR